MNEREKMEATVKGMLEWLRAKEGHALNNMIHPEFASCDPDTYTLVLSSKTEDWMKNPMGFLHGGIAASYMDFAMGILCRYFSGSLTPTIHMEENFLMPVPLGETIMIRSHIVKGGSSIYFTEAAIYLEDHPEQLLVTGSGTYHVPHVPIPV